jgi:glycine C-acetyltransferase
MRQAFLQSLATATSDLRAQGLYKQESVLASPQQAVIELEDGRRVLNLCANNYLGLANNSEVRTAARDALDRYGYGMSSVRFICGTHAIHRELERALSEFLGTDDTILYSSCFDANGGLFETLLDDRDAIISDALNHASIIDGVRLSKAQRFRYANGDMNDLEARLKETSSARARLIATDGVFSMDGAIAPLKTICDLADRYDALVMVDDSHATGFVGARGRGTHELHDVMSRVDILTGTLGKALGGAIGGYTSGRKEIIAWLRQRSRPYLFSNSLPPAIAAATLKVLDIVSRNDELRKRLNDNAIYFRQAMSEAGFRLGGAGHPIIPVMLDDARLATSLSQMLLERGVLAIGFSFPVVPHGKARIRTQMSAAHTREQLADAVVTFKAVGRELGVI